MSGTITVLFEKIEMDKKPFLTKDHLRDILKYYESCIEQSNLQLTIVVKPYNNHC